jgi:hypothetical protein
MAYFFEASNASSSPRTQGSGGEKGRSERPACNDGACYMLWEGIFSLPSRSAGLRRNRYNVAIG